MGCIIICYLSENQMLTRKMVAQSSKLKIRVSRFEQGFPHKTLFGHFWADLVDLWVGTLEWAKIWSNRAKFGVKSRPPGPPSNWESHGIFGRFGGIEPNSPKFDEKWPEFWDVSQIFENPGSFGGPPRGSPLWGVVLGGPRGF